MKNRVYEGRPANNDKKGCTLTTTNTPLRIGSLTIGNPLVLAPLAGYSDLAFRLLCREYGAGLVVSEMISCHGLHYRQQNTMEMTRTLAAERPVAMQLFGDEPELMGEAAALLSQNDIDLIDINMGCPVKKVVKKGAGCALMKMPVLAARIIRAVVAHSRVPVTVKFRSGWDHRNIIAPAFARMAEECGAAAVTVHGRTWSDGFAGSADWGIIRQVKESVRIPVIGNGDVKSRADAARMLAETGCDGVMIGRAAIGTPWIFSADAPDDPPLSFRLQALSRHLELLAALAPATKILPRIKNQAGRYFKGLPGGSEIRKNIYATESFARLQELLTALRADS